MAAYEQKAEPIQQIFYRSITSANSQKQTFELSNLPVNPGQLTLTPHIPDTARGKAQTAGQLTLVLK